MKQNPIPWVALAAVALVGLAALNQQGSQAGSSVPPAVPADEADTAPVSAANHGRPNPPVGVGASSPANPPTPAPAASTLPPGGRAAGSSSGPSERFTALTSELRPKVDAALLASDFVAADQHVEDALRTPGLEPLETQRLMAMKMSSRGMRGDHAAMLALMDEIIAVAPDSPLSAQLRKGRPQLEKIHRLGPDHPVLCETCGQMHAPGAHPATPSAREPLPSSSPPTR